MNPQTPNGWVKPERARTAEELKTLIAQREFELNELKIELFNIENGPRLEAIAQIRNIMRAHQLTPAEIAD